MEQLKQPVTLDAFETFIARPENMERRFERIAQEIFEVPSNTFVSKIAARILTFIGIYLMKHDIGHVTGEGGGYLINGDVYAPDVAYISYVRQPELARQGFNPNPPELVVEVISDPKNSQEQVILRRKVVNYLAVNAIVWIVDAFAQTIEVYKQGHAVQIIDINGTLDGGDVLPGFKLAVKDIFPEA